MAKRNPARPSAGTSRRPTLIAVAVPPHSAASTSTMSTTAGVMGRGSRDFCFDGLVGVGIRSRRSVRQPGAKVIDLHRVADLRHCLLRLRAAARRSVLQDLLDLVRMLLIVAPAFADGVE